MIFRRLKAPKNIRLLPIDSQDLAAHGADEKLIARDGHRCPYLPAEVKRRPHFLAGGRVDDVERAIAAGGEGAIADDRRRAQHRASRNLEFPQQLAVFREAVQVLIARAEQDVFSGEVRSRLDFGIGLECPVRLAGRRIQAVKRSVAVTDIDAVATHGDGRLDGPNLGVPFCLTCGQIKSIEVLVQGTDVDRVADDGCRAFDAVLGLERPADFQVLGQAGIGDAGLPWIAAEHGPVARSNEQILGAKAGDEHDQSTSGSQQALARQSVRTHHPEPPPQQAIR